MEAVDLPSTSTPLLSQTHAPKHPLYQRLWLRAMLYTIKILFTIGIQILKLPGVHDPSTYPTMLKAYPCRPKLKTRIFIPKNHQDEDRPLPLYFNIHGGGFALTEPFVDDAFCSAFSNQHNVLIVSLDYPKAPRHRFPSQLEALVDVINAVLSDSTLPIDRFRVAIGGSSAGGNLALGVCQDESLRGSLGAVVALYAPMDFSVDQERKRKKMFQGEVLPKSQMMMFSWGYVSEGQELRDPRLSPFYARRENLPKWMFLVGCGEDALCHEDERMARRMSELSSDLGERVGTDLCWEHNGIRWEEIVGEDHGKFLDNFFFKFSQS